MFHKLVLFDLLIFVFMFIIALNCNNQPGINQTLNENQNDENHWA